MASTTHRAIKVFIDSSVLFAAALSAKGSARDLTLRSTQGDYALYVSPLVLEEVERNLARKAPVASAARR